MSVFLSVIIPSYNESRNIDRGVLEEAHEWLSKQDFTWEMILSDDGSTDGTIDFLRSFAKSHPHVLVLENLHAGKAPTVKSGMLSASGSWRLFTDFDQSTPISEVSKLLDIAKENKVDVVIGSREISGAKRDKEPFYRHLMGRGFNFFVQLFAVPGIYDTQCGFKLFSKEATLALFNSLFVYGSNQPRKDAYTGAFDVELLFLARKKGFKIREIPVHWKHAATERVSPIKDSLRMFRDIVKIRIAYLSGAYRD